MHLKATSPKGHPFIFNAGYPSPSGEVDENYPATTGMKGEVSPLHFVEKG